MTDPARPASPSTGRPPERIAKLLARAGVASRREIERMIAEGRIALNGEALTTPATLLKSLAGVTVDGNPVAAPAPARLFAFHKPGGVLTAERDFSGRPTIYDRLPSDLPRVVPVGRLDLNTEGLLLLTTDGGLKRQLELPSSGVERSYRARAYGDITQAQLEDLMDGIEVEGVRYGSIDANLERRTGANVWIELTLTEGKNREVRRVLEHLGLRVSRLIRTRYGHYLLGDLPPGEVVEIRQHDLVAFRKELALPPERRSAEAPAPITPAVNRAARRAEAAQARETVEPDAPRRRTAPAKPPRPDKARRPGDARPARPRAAAAEAPARGERADGSAKPRARPDRTRGELENAPRSRGRSDRQRGPASTEDAPRPHGRSDRQRPSAEVAERPARTRTAPEAPARSERADGPARPRARPDRARGELENAPRPRGRSDRQRPSAEAAERPARARARPERARTPAADARPKRPRGKPASPGRPATGKPAGPGRPRPPRPGKPRG